MKNTGKILSFSLGLLILFSAYAQANPDKNALLGTWNYEAPQAPYEYSKGQLIITEKEGKLHSQIKIGNSVRDLSKTSLEEGILSMNAYVEGELVTIKVSLKEGELAGTATYSGGSIPIKGKKE
ncbi:MAG: hypothetical protein JJU28_24395 [Cyclobacteriaceae bacterium]|nr:hypothetical protein [Cyclobacteriaceae bacterium]